MGNPVNGNNSDSLFDQYGNFNWTAPFDTSTPTSFHQQYTRDLRAAQRIAEVAADIDIWNGLEAFNAHVQEELVLSESRQSMQRARLLLDGGNVQPVVPPTPAAQESGWTWTGIAVVAGAALGIVGIGYVAYQYYYKGDGKDTDGGGVVPNDVDVGGGGVVPNDVDVGGGGVDPVVTDPVVTDPVVTDPVVTDPIDSSVPPPASTEGLLDDLKPIAHRLSIKQIRIESLELEISDNGFLAILALMKDMDGQHGDRVDLGNIYVSSSFIFNYFIDKGYFLDHKGKYLGIFKFPRGWISEMALNGFSLSEIMKLYKPIEGTSNVSVGNIVVPGKMFAEYMFARFLSV